MKDKLYTTVLALTVIAFILSLVGFISPYWLQKIPGTKSRLLRLGLWEACFDAYMHEDHLTKIYYGCFFIYYWQFDNMRNIMTPGWFVLVQAVYTIGFVVSIIAAVLICLQVCRLREKYTSQSLIALMTFHGIAAVCLFISVVAVGSQSTSSDWIAPTTMTTLSFAYAAAVTSMVASVGAIIALVFIWRRVRDNIVPTPDESPKKTVVSPVAMDPRRPFSLSSGEEV